MIHTMMLLLSRQAKVLLSLEKLSQSAWIEWIPPDCADCEAQRTDAKEADRMSHCFELSERKILNYRGFTY